MNIKIEQLVQAFQKKYAGEYAVFSAPGRINIIGEHTDYNDGFVLPGAIDKTMDIVIRMNENSTVINAFAFDLNEEESFSVEATSTKYGWSKYLLGVVGELRKLGLHIPGFDCVFGGNVPIGSGMSSSAAFECAIGAALNELCHLNLSRLQIAKAGQMAEHNYVGVRCGIMDQFASMFGETEKLIKLDCRSMEYELIPFKPNNISIVLLDTKVSHSLASSEYNKRRLSCEAGVQKIASKYPNVKSLRDVSIPLLNEFTTEFDAETFNTCLYVVSEIDRLKKACVALSADDFTALGRLMFETHDGLQHLYKVSCPELDFLVDIAGKTKGVIGSRMMGGGFGGCTISLVENVEKQNFINEAREKFNLRFGHHPQLHEVSISKGAQRLL